MVSYLSYCYRKLLILFDQGSKDTLHFETNLLYDSNYPINYLNVVQKIKGKAIFSNDERIAYNIFWLVRAVY